MGNLRCLSSSMWAVLSFLLGAFSAPVLHAAAPGEKAPSGSKEASTEHSAAGESPRKVRVMVPSFRATTDTVTVGDVETVTGLAVFQLSKVKRFDVVSGADVREIIDLEAEKQALGGCLDSDCMSKIADALQAEVVLFGQIGRLGARFVVHLALIESATVKVLKRAQFEVRRLADLPFEMAKAVDVVAQDYGGVPGAGELRERTSLVAEFSNYVNRPDAAMLTVMFGFATASICLPLIPAIPLLQSAVLWLFGEDLTGRVYPLWWAAALAGFGAYGLAVATLVGGGFVQGFAGQQIAGIDPLRGLTLPFAVSAVGFGILFLAEPVLAFILGTARARDADVFSELVPKDEVMDEGDLDAAKTDSRHDAADAAPDATSDDDDGAAQGAGTPTAGDGGDAHLWSVRPTFGPSAQRY